MKTLILTFKVVLAFCVLSIACSIVSFAEDETSAVTPEKTSAASADVGKKVSLAESVKLASDGEAHPPNVWMEQKLKHSQKIFAGMVQGDMFAVEDAARHLKLLNRLESFVHGRSKTYRAQLRLFQYANDEILKGAEDKNPDRVLLGYNQLTVSCVGCHKQLRNDE